MYSNKVTVKAKLPFWPKLLMKASKYLLRRKVSFSVSLSLSLFPHNLPISELAGLRLVTSSQPPSISPEIRPASGCNPLRRAKRRSHTHTQEVKRLKHSLTVVCHVSDMHPLVWHTHTPIHCPSGCCEIGSVAKEGCCGQLTSDRLARVYFLATGFRFVTVQPAIP